MITGPLEGKVALVTGASRGIGRAIALELAGAGARVAVNYHSGKAAALKVAEEITALRRHAGEALARAVGEGSARATDHSVSSKVAGLGERVLVLQADVSNAEAARGLVEQVVAHWGRLDILVNNAGITRDRTLRKLSDDEWQAVITTNLNSVFFCTSAAMPAMIRQQYGRVVNISSVIGQSGNVGQANYAAAKGAIISFTKSAALELAKHNVTVNAVAPGFTETDMFANVPAEIQDQIKAKIPLARFARPEEIANAVRFLVVEGDYITGQQLNVNGGIYV